MARSMENSCNDVINYVEIKSERRINLLREASICPLTTQARGPNPFTLHIPVEFRVSFCLSTPIVLGFSKLKGCNFTLSLKVQKAALMFP